MRPDRHRSRAARQRYQRTHGFASVPPGSIVRPTRMTGQLPSVFHSGAAGGRHLYSAGPHRQRKTTSPAASATSNSSLPTSTIPTRAAPMSAPAAGSSPGANSVALRSLASPAAAVFAPIGNLGTFRGPESPPILAMVAHSYTRNRLLRTKARAQQNSATERRKDPRRMRWREFDCDSEGC